jgi:hypothetical protein
MSDVQQEVSQEEDFRINGSNFPNEDVHPDRKLHPKYILQYGKAIHNNGTRFGQPWGDDDQFDTLMSIAQGNLSIENIRKMFGYFRDPSDASEDGSRALAYIDVKVLNLATKYINRAVAKMVNNHYDLQLEGIDPTSVDRKKSYEASVKAYYNFRGFLAKMKIDPKEFFPDLDIEVLPEHPDELLFEMLTNHKVKEAIEAELGLQLLHEMNDFEQTRRLVDRFITIVGTGHVHCYRDRNGVPREELINPKYYVGSYFDREDYKDQEYAGFYDFPTVSQFRQEARGWIPDDEIENIVSHYMNQNTTRNVSHPSSNVRDYDGLDYIPVLRFYFLSNDKRKHVVRKNQFNNDTIMEPRPNWKPKDGERVVATYDTEYTCVYGGVMVLDTDWVYDYGQKMVPKSNLVEVKLPIVSVSPNYYEGKTVSFLSQMIEPLYMINVAHNKIKEVLAKGWFGIMEIDFTELESVALGAGGKKWTARTVYQHFLKTGRLIKRGAVNKHDQKYGNSAVSVSQSGVQLADYFNTFTTYVNVLEAMIGTAAAESSQQPDRLAVRVAQMSQNVGDLDMEYLYNADQTIFRNVSHVMLLLLQQAKADGVGIEGFISALGQQFSVPEDIAYCDFGMFLQRAPGPDEWADFFEDLRKGLDKGIITHLDSAYIREVKNLKKARQILGQRIKVNERKAAQAAQQNNQMAMDANKAATQEKFMADREVAILTDKMENARMERQAQIDQALIDRKAEHDARLMASTDKAKKDIARQKSTDELIKEAGKNQTQKQIAEQKAIADAKKKTKE